MAEWPFCEHTLGAILLEGEVHGKELGEILNVSHVCSYILQAPPYHYVGLYTSVHGQDVHCIDSSNSIECPADAIFKTCKMDIPQICANVELEFDIVW